MGRHRTQPAASRPLGNVAARRSPLVTTAACTRCRSLTACGQSDSAQRALSDWPGLWDIGGGRGHVAAVPDRSPLPLSSVPNDAFWNELIFSTLNYHRADPLRFSGGGNTILWNVDAIERLAGASQPLAQGRGCAISQLRGGVHSAATDAWPSGGRLCGS